MFAADISHIWQCTEESHVSFGLFSRAVEDFWLPVLFSEAMGAV